MKKMDKMKKMTLGLWILSLFALEGRAQLGTGGLPLSFRSTKKVEITAPVTQAKLPDWNNGLKEWESKKEPKPYLIALTTATDFGFPNSGILYTNEDGIRIWKGQIKVEGAKALGFYYDNFQLPEGVKYFISNASGTQILGAYTSANNDASHTFVNEAVVGESINFELNIEPGVNLSDIKLHINKSAAYFRGIENLQAFHTIDGNLQTIDAVDSALSGSSSVCMINAICPQGDNYANQRKATFQWLMVVGGGVGACSATMVNTTANTPGNCKQYFLLASHCNGSNDITSTAFNQTLLRYNFQHTSCQPTVGIWPTNTHTLNGSNFVARSVIPSSADDIKGDFLLLETRQALPADWEVVLAGWNHAANISLTQASPKKFIGFHHPGGDAKKLSTSQQIESYDLGAPSSHWVTELAEGLAAEGSSGSGLFDGDGRLIGVASVAAVGQGVTSSCQLNPRGENIMATTSNIILYSKLSYDWDYAQDGTTNTMKLKPWLDPSNTGAVTIDPVKADCTPLNGNGGTTITNTNKLDEGLTIFPNPTHTGNITLKINLKEATNLSMELYNISGKKINSYTLNKIQSGSYTINMSAYPNGVYLLKIKDGYNTISRKIMLSQ